MEITSFICEDSEYKTWEDEKLQLHGDILSTLFISFKNLILSLSFGGFVGKNARKLFSWKPTRVYRKRHKWADRLSRANRREEMQEVHLLYDICLRREKTEMQKKDRLAADKAI